MNPTPPKLPAATRRAVLLLSYATFSSMTAQRLCDAMLPELARHFQTGLAQVGQVISTFAIVYGLCQLLYGPLGDRLGKYRVVTWAALGCALGNGLAFFAASLGWLVLARALVAMGAAAIIPMSLAWIGDAVPYAQRQQTLARVGLGTTLGITGGQLLGGVFSDTLGWRWAFAFMTLLFVLVGLLLWRNDPGPSQTETTGSGVRLGYARQAWQIITVGWSRTILLLALLEGAAGFGVLAIWAAHLHETLGLSLAAAGAIVALFGLGGMAYMAVASSLIPRLGEHGLARIGVILLGASAWVLAGSPLWWPCVPASLVAGFGFFMFHNTMQTHATQMAPANRGTAVSLFAAFLFMGQSLGVWTATQAAAWLGTTPVIVAGSALLVAVGWYFSLALQRRRAQA